MPISIGQQRAKPSDGSGLERVVLGPLGERIEHRVQVARLGRSAVLDPPEDLPVDPARDPPGLAKRLQALGQGVRTHLQIVLDLEGPHVLVLEHHVDGDQGGQLAQEPDELGELAPACPGVCQTIYHHPDFAVRRGTPTTPEDGGGAHASHVVVYHSRTRTVVEDRMALPPESRRPTDTPAEDRDHHTPRTREDRCDR